MLDYFRSSIHLAADKRTSQVLRNERYNEFNEFFQEIECFEAMLVCRSKGVVHALLDPLKEELEFYKSNK